MRLDGNWGLIQMTEDSGICAEVSTQDEFVLLSGGMNTVYSFHYYASILTLHSWFCLHYLSASQGERWFYVKHNSNCILIMLVFP